MNWHHHPAVRSGDALTVGERAADRMRNGMGSWAFVLGAVLFLAGYMVADPRFDRYPYILLNLMLSCLAALQGAILLIAAKRQDQIASELAKHDYATNQRTEAISERIEALTVEVHQVVVRGAPAGRRL